MCVRRITHARHARSNLPTRSHHQTHNTVTAAHRRTALRGGRAWARRPRSSQSFSHRRLRAARATPHGPAAREGHNTPGTNSQQCMMMWLAGWLVGWLAAAVSAGWMGYPTASQQAARRTAPADAGGGPPHTQRSHTRLDSRKSQPVSPLPKKAPTRDTTNTHGTPARAHTHTRTTPLPLLQGHSQPDSKNTTHSLVVHASALTQTAHAGQRNG
jgi:hypothetical protein